MFRADRTVWSSFTDCLESSILLHVSQGFPPGALRRIILTASGGAFRDWPAEDLVKVISNSHGGGEVCYHAADASGFS